VVPYVERLSKCVDHYVVFKEAANAFSLLFSKTLEKVKPVEDAPDTSRGGVKIKKGNFYINKNNAIMVLREILGQKRITDEKEVEKKFKDDIKQSKTPLRRTGAQSSNTEGKRQSEKSIASHHMGDSPSGSSRFIESQRGSDDMMPVSAQRHNSFSLLEINKKVGMLQFDRSLTVLQQKFSYHGSSELSALKHAISPCTNTIKVFAESIKSLIPASEEDVSEWRLRSKVSGTPSQFLQSEIKTITEEERRQKAFWTD
jgi:hypothetical protein